MGKIERQIQAEIARDEAESRFKEKIAQLEKQRDGLLDLGAEAELGGDSETFEKVQDSVLYLEETLGSLRRGHVDFKLATMTGEILGVQVAAFEVLEHMSQGGVPIPNYKKIIKTQERLAMYMRDSSQAAKMIKKATAQANPTSRANYSDGERQRVRDMIAARRAGKMGATITESANSLFDEIAREKQL